MQRQMQWQQQQQIPFEDDNKKGNCKNVRAKGNCDGTCNRKVIMTAAMISMGG
jgi:hypothetical protein